MKGRLVASYELNYPAWESPPAEGRTSPPAHCDSRGQAGLGAGGGAGWSPSVHSINVRHFS